MLSSQKKKLTLAYYVVYDTNNQITKILANSIFVAMQIMYFIFSNTLYNNNNK